MDSFMKAKDVPHRIVVVIRESKPRNLSLLLVLPIRYTDHAYSTRKYTCSLQPV
ncbi:MAG: hypothetical protein QW733_05795 [Desulfurococcaceae archaeon]